MSAMLDVGDLSNRIGHVDKDIVDVVTGFTQVINRNILLQINYSFSHASGYLNDPYKIVSIVDPVSGDAVPAIPTPGVAGPRRTSTCSRAGRISGPSTASTPRPSIT